MWFGLLSHALRHDRSLTGSRGPRGPPILLRPRPLVQICRLEPLRCGFKTGQGAGARPCTQLLRRLEVWKPPSAVPVTLDGPVGKLGTNQTTPVLAAFKRTMSEGHWGQRHIGLVDSQGPGWGARRTQRAPGRGTSFWPKPSSHLPTSWWPSWNHLELSCCPF